LCRLKGKFQKDEVIRMSPNQGKLYKYVLNKRTQKHTQMEGQLCKETGRKPCEDDRDQSDGRLQTQECQRLPVNPRS
jgi:hypothetical protein